jgi:glycosyltransferase involved in cell wall biosynthesis
VNRESAREAPLVSVVTPTFNSGRYALQTIETILSQTYSNLEIIVVDDSSTDGTPERIRAINDARLRVIEVSHRGVAGARNAGVESGAGELVAFLDHDDSWFPDKLAEQVAVLNDNSDVCAVGCFMSLITDQGVVIGKTGQTIRPDDRVRLLNAELMPFPMSSVLVRKKALDEVGGFDEELATARSGGVDDLDLMSRLAQVGSIECVPRVLGAYRHHRTSFTASHFALQRTGTQFVQERRRAEREGRTLSWDEFIGSYQPGVNVRRRDAAAAAYYAAGMHLADREWIRAAGAAIKSALLAPRYTFDRLRINRPWSRPRTERV